MGKLLLSSRLFFSEKVEAIYWINTANFVCHIAPIQRKQSEISKQRDSQGTKQCPECEWEQMDCNPSRTKFGLEVQSKGTLYFILRVQQFCFAVMLVLLQKFCLLLARQGGLNKHLRMSCAEKSLQTFWPWLGAVSEVNISVYLPSLASTAAVCLTLQPTYFTANWQNAGLAGSPNCWRRSLLLSLTFWHPPTKVTDCSFPPVLDGGFENLTHQFVVDFVMVSGSRKQFRVRLAAKIITLKSLNPFFVHVLPSCRVLWCSRKFLCHGIKPLTI